jgi:hypothetical protein
MSKIAVELGSLEVRWGDNPEMYRNFSAQVAQAGKYAGQLIGSTRVLKVTFTQESGLADVDIEPLRDRDEPWDVEYLPQLSDDRKARKTVAGAIKIALDGSEGDGTMPQEDRNRDLRAGANHHKNELFSKVN